MTISAVTKPIVQAILGKPEAPVKGSLEEAQWMKVQLEHEIEELTNRKPTISPEKERQRLDDLAIAQRTKEAWDAALAGLVKEREAQKLAEAGVRAKETAVAARQWQSEAADALWAGWGAIDAGWALATAEYQATGTHSYLKSGGKYSIGESPQLDILQKARDFYMDFLEALGIARKVSPSRGVWTLVRIQNKE